MVIGDEEFRQAVDNGKAFCHAASAGENCRHAANTHKNCRQAVGTDRDFYPRSQARRRLPRSEVGGGAFRHADASVERSRRPGGPVAKTSIGQAPAVKTFTTAGPSAEAFTTHGPAAKIFTTRRAGPWRCGDAGSWEEGAPLRRRCALARPASGAGDQAAEAGPAQSAGARSAGWGSVAGSGLISWLEVGWSAGGTQAAWGSAVRVSSGVGQVARGSGAGQLAGAL